MFSERRRSNVLLQKDVAQNLDSLLASSLVLRQSVWPMAKSKPPSSPAADEISELREEIASLKDHIRLLVDAIDEVREELSWLTRNGLPRREPLPPVPVLKQMAADPCADDWGERLVIERGQSRSTPSEPPKSEANAVKPASTPSEPGRLF